MVQQTAGAVVNRVARDLLHWRRRNLWSGSRTSSMPCPPDNLSTRTLPTGTP